MNEGCSDHRGVSRRHFAGTGRVRLELVDQARIDRFADTTEDWQFIHVDPVRAQHTPFGGTIAHGFLTLSLLGGMIASAVPPVEGAGLGLNYGLNNLRFLAPLRSGKRVRGRFRLKDFAERAPGQWLSTLEVTMEIEGEEKPLLSADWIVLSILPAF